MSLYHHSSICIYFVVLAYYIQNVLTAAIGEKSNTLKNKLNEIASDSDVLSNKNQILAALDTLFNLHDIEEYQNGYPVELERIRQKRQSGAGKYTDAAKMGQIKIFRLWLQMFKNAWAPVYVGGAHPLHHEVPKAIVFLFKQRIVDFFFPDVGVPDKTQ